MKIYFVRHGIAGQHVFGSAKADAERQLTAEGKAETKRVATGLKQLGINPEIVISSPLVRAKETAEIFRVVFNVKKELKITETLSPGVTPSAVYKFLKELLREHKAEEIMLVGHEPDMGLLLGNLISLNAGIDIPFKKAGVCRVDVSDMPPTHAGILKWFVTPKIASMLAD